MRSNRPGGQQDQPELRVRRFPFTENRVGNLTDQGETDCGRIIPLNVHERFNQFALIDANQLPGFPLEIPNPNVREHLKSRAESALRKSRPARDAAHSAGLAIEKTDQPVALAERKGAKNYRLRLLEWHPLSRRADRLRLTRKQICATKF